MKSIKTDFEGSLIALVSNDFTEVRDFFFQRNEEIQEVLTNMLEGSLSY